MMQLKRKTFVAALAVAVIIGAALGAFTSTRAELGRAVVVARAPSSLPVLRVRVWPTIPGLPIQKKKAERPGL